MGEAFSDLFGRARRRALGDHGLEKAKGGRQSRKEPGRPADPRAEMEAAARREATRGQGGRLYGQAAGPKPTAEPGPLRTAGSIGTLSEIHEMLADEAIARGDRAGGEAHRVHATDLYLYANALRDRSEGSRPTAHQTDRLKRLPATAERERKIRSVAWPGTDLYVLDDIQDRMAATTSEEHRADLKAQETAFMNDLYAKYFPNQTPPAPVQAAPAQPETFQESRLGAFQETPRQHPDLTGRPLAERRGYWQTEVASIQDELAAKGGPGNNLPKTRELLQARDELSRVNVRAPQVTQGTYPADWGQVPVNSEKYRQQAQARNVYLEWQKTERQRARDLRKPDERGMIDPEKFKASQRVENYIGEMNATTQIPIMPVGARVVQSDGNGGASGRRGTVAANFQSPGLLAHHAVAWDDGDISTGQRSVDDQGYPPDIEPYTDPTSEEIRAIMGRRHQAMATLSQIDPDASISNGGVNDGKISVSVEQSSEANVGASGWVRPTRVGFDYEVSPHTYHQSILMSGTSPSMKGVLDVFGFLGWPVEGVEIPEGPAPYVAPSPQPREEE